MAELAPQLPHLASGGAEGLGPVRWGSAAGKDGGNFTGGSDDLAFRRRAQVGVADHPDGVPAALHPAGEQGIVGQNRAHACHDGGAAVAVLMDAAAGLFTGDPPGSAGAGGDLAVRSHGVF